MQKTKKSFTLIELITVIVIIVVLSSAGFFLVSKLMKNGRDSRRYADANTIATALQGYFFVHKDYPDPSDKIKILDQSGTLIGYQGILDKNVMANGLDMTKLPVDPSDKNLYYSYVKAINPWEDKKGYEVGTVVEAYREKDNGEKIYRGKYVTPYIISSNTISTCEKGDKLSYPSKISVINYETNEYARKTNLPQGEVMLDLLNLKGSCEGQVVANIVGLTGWTIPEPEVKTCPAGFYFNGDYCDDKCSSGVTKGKTYPQISYDYTGMAFEATGTYVGKPADTLINGVRTYYAEIKCYEGKGEIVKERYVDTTKPKTIVINDYTYMTGDINIGGTDVGVADPTKFTAEEEVLIITSQYTGVGQYEFNKIKTIVGSTFKFKNPVKYKYNKTYTQIVSVPNYVNFDIPVGLTIVPIAWNGNMGGIVVFRATGIVKNSGSITAVGYGYRGGSYKTCAGCRWCGSVGCGSPWVHGYRGESYLGGLNSISYLPNDIAGGSGRPGWAGSGNPTGGGGGGHASGGENAPRFRSEVPGYGGGTVGVTDLSKLYFGGGGGSGGLHDIPGYSGPGGGGGGMVIVIAGEIDSLTGTILSNGGNGTFAAGNCKGGNGGGAGGIVRLASPKITLGTGKVTANGGAGSNGTAGYIQRGGNGGIGRVKFSTNTLVGSSSPVAVSDTWGTFLYPTTP